MFCFYDGTRELGCFVTRLSNWVWKTYYENKIMYQFTLLNLMFCISTTENNYGCFSIVDVIRMLTYEEVHIEWVRSSLINEKKISKFMFTEVPTWKIISEYTGIKNSTVCIEKNEWIWEYFYTHNWQKKEVHTVMTEKFTSNKKDNTNFVHFAVLKKKQHILTK
jgi:hypothetical protein